MPAKMLAASIVGALSLSSGVVARSLANSEHPNDTNGSSATCFALALGTSEGENQELTVSAAASAAAYICHGEGSEEDIVSQTASAFALAVAYGSIECELEGNAQVWGSADANAYASAEVWVNSYFDAFAAASNCETCEAFASSWGYISKYVFLEAFASVSVQVDAVSSADDIQGKSVSAQQLSVDLESVTATAWAVAFAAAANFKKEEGCLAFVNAGGCIWTEGHPDEETYCAECTAVAFSESQVEAIDAIAAASAGSVAIGCGDSVAIAELEVAAYALAEATAYAISFAYASCDVDEGGFACAAALSDIAVWVDASAYAWAKAWAGAFNCDGKCKATVDVYAEAVKTILVDASTQAYAALCTGEGHWTVAQLHEEIHSKSVCAVAEAIALSIATDGFCLAAGIVYVDTSDATCPDPKKS